MRNAIAFGVAAFAAALALPALAQEESTYDHAGARAHADDHMVHGAALNAADQDLANRIAAEISRDKAVHNTPVTVAVKDGNVTLSGPTDNRQTVTHIEDDAAKVAGRSHVAPMV